MIKKTVVEPYVLEIYALAVCFVTLVCFMISLAIGAYSLWSIINPAFTLNSHTYSQYQTNDRYWASTIQRRAYEERNSYEARFKERPDASQLTEERQAAWAQVLAKERHEGWQTLVKTIITSFITAAIFALHWKVARRMCTRVMSEIYDPRDE